MVLYAVVHSCIVSSQKNFFDFFQLYRLEFSVMKIDHQSKILSISDINYLVFVPQFSGHIACLLCQIRIFAFTTCTQILNLCDFS